MKLFLDANVLFTAAYSPQGISRAFFALAQAGHCSLVTSAFALDEARRNLAAKVPAAVEELAKLLPSLLIVPEPAPDLVRWALQLPLPVKDAPITAAAVQGGVSVLVTGDRRDFDHLFGQTVKGIKVVSPRDVLAELLKS
jgi:predicted nucleic acid-binding protein